MKFRPVHDRILVDQDALETTTASGLILHHEAADAVNRGTVVAVGPGRLTKSGDYIPMDIKLNERVLFPPGAGLQVKVDDTTYLVLKEDEVIAVIE